MERQEERDRPALYLGALHGHTRASQRMANGLKPCLAPGEGTHVLDEAERSLHDALCVLAATVKDARVVLGGGFPEMAMARVVRALGRTSFVYRHFPRCLRPLHHVVEPRSAT